MNLIKLLGAEKEALELTSVVSQSVSPAERALIMSAVGRLVRAVGLRVLLKLGLPVGAIGAAMLVIAGSQATGEAPPGVAGTTERVEVAAKSGTDPYAGRLLACDPKAQVIPPTESVIQHSDSAGPVYTVARDNESIVWSSANFTNPLATHWYLQDNRQVSEDALMDAEAISCVKKKAGVK